MKTTKTKKRVARKAASKKRRSNKAPSAKQLAARAKFAAAAKARSRKAAKKRTRNKTVIIKPKRVLVINGKKKAAKKRNSATASQKVNRAGSKTVSKLKSIRTEFTGLPIRGTNTMNVSDKSPSTMAKLAQLLDLTLTDGRIIKPQAGTTWVCSDSKKKIHFATTLTRLFDGPAGDVGRVKLIGYRALKPSVGSNKIESYEHLFGEEGGKQPTLVSDGKGGLYLRGGSYIITQDGIIN